MRPICEEVIQIDNMQELKAMPIWVCWNRKEKGGRTTKIPCSAAGGATGTNEKYRSTWVSYDEAVAAAEREHYSGVGFIIPQGWFFLDIDHKGIDDPWVQIRLDRFNSYTEYSQSGDGIHIYGKCDFAKLPTREVGGKLKIDDRYYYIKHPTNGMEIYIGGLTNRFAVFTGNAIRNIPPADCTDATLLTFKTDMLRKVNRKESRAEPATVTFDGSTDEGDFDLICNLLRQKNGERFRKLYCDADMSDYLGDDGRPDESRADMALASMIAFRVGNDPGRIFSVIRQSALMRDKWNRADYRENTIRKAIESCNGKFHHSIMPHPYFIVFDDNGKPHVRKPLLARYVREHLKYILVRDNGKQGLLIYVYKNGYYQLYAPEMFKGAIKQFIADYDETLITMNVVNEVFQLLTTDLNFVSQDELDSDEHLINVENGLLYVTENETTLLPHSSGVYSTIRIPVTWTGQPSSTPVHDSYLNTLADANKDVIRLLNEFRGVAFSNVKGWRAKKSLFLVGPGNTGKSQEKALTERMLGKGNYIGIDLKDIEARFGTGAIYGTRLAGSSDMSFMTVDELKTFKKITGGDSLFAEFKGQQAFEYTYGGLLWFCMNKLPKFGGDDGQWVYDRIMVVHCPNVIPADKQDKQLLDKMYAERDGIFYQSVKALQRVMRNGYRFTEPESVTQARAAYRSENSSVIGFFDECMIPWQGGKIQPNCTTGRVYKVYRAWCEDNCNGYAKSVRDFREQLTEYLNAADFSEITTRRNGNTYFKDYGISHETKEQYPCAYGSDFLD